MTINIGDTVRFLREVGGGTVTGFRKGGFILVEDKDGFEIPMLESDLVVIPNEKAKTQNTSQTTQPQADTRTTTLPSQSGISIQKDVMSLEERVEKLEQMVQKLSRRLEELEAANALRAHAKTTPTGPAQNSKPAKDEILEIDLHAHALLDSTDNLSASDIKDYQMNIFRQTMDQYRKDKGRRIVFIHGNGDGVLRKAILTELKYSYKTCRHQDASFQQYGFGATMVTIG